MWKNVWLSFFSFSPILLNVFCCILAIRAKITSALERCCKRIQQQTWNYLLMSESTQHGCPCLVHSKLEVNMPKFKMEQSYLLHKILPGMGIASVFSNSANLTKMSKDAGLKVSEVSAKFVNILLQHTCIFQQLQMMNDDEFYLFFSVKKKGAAQSCDWGGWDWDHCSSFHNNWHYSIFVTQDFQCQQTILLLHIPWSHKLSAVHGQGDWPHQRIAVMTGLFELWSDCAWPCHVYSVI